MHLTRIRAGMFGVLLSLAVGLVTPPFAICQKPLSFLFGVGRLKPSEVSAKPASKSSFAFRATELYFAGDTAFDMTTTVRSMDHPTTALRSDHTFLTHYYMEEEGWAGVFGRRDKVTAVAANVFLNAGIDRFSRKLYSRGGKWRALAYGVLFTKGTFNALAAGGNIRNEERINEQVRLATGYKGQIIWTK
jgi:hypothetical protein